MTENKTKNTPVVTWWQVVLVLIGLISMGIGRQTLVGPMALFTFMIAAVCWSVAGWSWLKMRGYVPEDDEEEWVKSEPTSEWDDDLEDDYYDDYEDEYYDENR